MNSEKWIIIGGRGIIFSRYILVGLVNNYI